MVVGVWCGLLLCVSDDVVVFVLCYMFFDVFVWFFFGYVMFEGVVLIGVWLLIEVVMGSEVELFGWFVWFIDDFDGFVWWFEELYMLCGWSELFVDMFVCFFDLGVVYVDVLVGVCDVFDVMLVVMMEGVFDEVLLVVVVCVGFVVVFDDLVCGGVLWGGVMFLLLMSLCGLLYCVVCLFGMDDGVLLSFVCVDEFDLMVVLLKLGDW